MAHNGVCFVCYHCKDHDCKNCVGVPCDCPCEPVFDTHIPTGIESEVCDDIASRQAKGIAKYGTTVADNPAALKEWLQHAYEETLDQAIYLKRAIREIEKGGRDAVT